MKFRMRQPLLAALATAACSPSPLVEWPVYGGDAGGSKYSIADQITRENVDQLVPAWTWDTGDPANPPADSGAPARPGNFQATPLMIRDTLYLPTPLNQVVALDASTGQEYWRFDPGAYRYGQPSNGTGLVHRGVAAWTDGRERRIFINSRFKLFALDASTGKPIPSFGNGGWIDLTEGLSRPVNRIHYTNTSPPVIWGDLVILGNGVGDRLMYRGDPPGDVQAINARTGKRVWAFNPVPTPGQVGHDTWGNGSWEHTGHTNVWAPFTIDSARAIVYLPFGTPSNDWYGGRRPGDNLFAEAIVALDIRTGERLWHYQIVHHGVWDYDLPAPPNVVTVKVPNGRVDAVIVPTKQGFIFAFNGATGEPLWPIEERSVPQSDVPGEQTSPTQPFPTRPAPVSPIGFTESDLADFTPEIFAAATQEFRKYRAGPLYSPPSMQGTITLPGSIGGIGWGGGAFDAATNTLFVKATTSPSLWRIIKRPAPSDTNDAEYQADLGGSGLSLEIGGGRIPLVKPPYGTLTAIDMTTGEHKWQIPLGDTPAVRNNPALKDVALPEYLGVAGAPGAIVTAGGLLFVTGGGETLFGIDRDSGAILWKHNLGAGAYAVPMTYVTSAGKQFVVISTGARAETRLQAFALPQQ